MQRYLGELDGKGEVFRNPLLAASYERIAKNGPGAFYEGETAERIVSKSRELGGFMSLEDLRAHRADWVEPVSSSYRGYDVSEIPPNGQGICALQILNLMEGFDVAGLGHNVLPRGCIPEVVADFLASGSKDLDSSCTKKIAPFPPFIDLMGPSP